jgi:acyl dehydratase
VVGCAGLLVSGQLWGGVQLGNSGEGGLNVGDALYFEDFEVGTEISIGEYLVTKQEIVEFAKKWDPQPFHIDERAAEESAYGGLTASGSHIMAIRTWLLHHGKDTSNSPQPEKQAAIIGALGWDEVRFQNPVRPGDRLFLTREVIGKRESRSKPGRGVVQQLMTVTNQNRETVLIHKDSILVATRSGTVPQGASDR